MMVAFDVLAVAYDGMSKNGLKRLNPIIVAPMIVRVKLISLQGVRTARHGGRS